MIDLSDVKVGDTLYDAGIRSDQRQNRNPKTLYVQKVARQYLYASFRPEDGSDCCTNIKIKRNSGWAEGWMGYQLYRSEEEYKEMVYRHDLCDKIKKVFGNSYGTNIPDITTAELRGIAKTLKVEF